MRTIKDLRNEENQLLATLVELEAEHQQNVAPLKARLAEIDIEWPHRTITWREAVASLVRLEENDIPLGERNEH